MGSLLTYYYMEGFIKVSRRENVPRLGVFTVFFQDTLGDSFAENKLRPRGGLCALNSILTGSIDLPFQRVLLVLLREVHANLHHVLSCHLECVGVAF